MLILLTALVAVSVVSLLIGAGEVGPRRVLGLLYGVSDSEAQFIVWELRAPRTLIGIVVGIALGVAGALLQAISRNPLAEPGLLGVSAGAAFAVALALVLGASAATLRISVAQLGALIGCVCVLSVARFRGVGNDPVRLVLAGAAFSGLLGSLTSLMLLYDQRAADEIRFWVVGSLAGRRLDDLVAVLPSLLVAAIAVVIMARPLAALALGERAASGLGHHPTLIRWVAVGCVALLVGAATAIAGPIAFVGLVVPFVARAFAGPDIRRTLWFCLPIGPLIVLSADIISRVVVAPSELPLGVLTALCGAPVLIAVVRAKRLPML
ncbi:FecCD family ABC transporter permease [Vreelandella venusta]|uniref:ABC transporter permease n=1 Tax=Vreelandella venusta TaxID=44935 RepID=A0AAQ0CIG5_9GAMM|nr:iron ABC transporter permease [Halomonas venusta]AZM98012.1 iron ABC transporter permease [Halomonas venusta]NPT31983.1 ABC transporter permease [Halomonas venusta]QPI66272.1 iron ABC transporter permease [Halomonas venusta]QRL05393.1 iron ABC transporter permease [Halomonas venusta]